MGEVYRADDLRLGQAVALKLMSEAVARGHERLQRFTDEVRLARSIVHPNVCRVYDIGHAEGWYYLSMEYVDGETLASLLRRIGQLPMPKALEMARQLCAGVAAAHERGVLHRDLKPSNIMVDGRGQIRIMDFGLAIASHADVREVAGTPGYMAPEQVAGGPVTTKTDLYALGRVLTHILPRGVDPEVTTTVQSCLDPNPNKRPESAYAVAAALPRGDVFGLTDGAIPTPAMVASAPTSGALRPAVAWALFAVVAAGSLGIASQAYRFNVAPSQVPKAPEVLAERAREILAQRGETSPPAVDRAFWWSAAEFDNRVWFTYRESATLLVPVNTFRVVTAADPPPDRTHLRMITLTAEGDFSEAEGLASRTAWSPARSRMSEVFLWIWVVIAFVGGGILARRNLRAGEGDRKGASRIAVFIFIGGVVSVVLRAHHVPSFVDESTWLFTVTGWAMVWSSFAWLAYVSFEPHVRRWWPQTLISWTRLLAGRWRDPLVGRDVLLGMFAGLLAAFLHVTLLAATSRVPPLSFRVPVLEALGSPAVFSNVMLVAVLNSLQFSLTAMAGLVLFRLILRRTWIAVGAIVAFAVPLLASSASAIDVVAAAAVAVSGIFVLLRIGVLSHVAMIMTSGFVASLPLTLDADAWYFGRSVVVLLTLVGLAFYAFVVALGGRPAFGEMSSERSAPSQ